MRVAANAPNAKPSDRDHDAETVGTSATDTSAMPATAAHVRQGNAGARGATTALPVRQKTAAALGATIALLALIVLCAAWEGWLAPLRPGGSALLLKAVPLLLALPGVWRRRLYTLQWASMLILLYFAEGVVRSWSERGLSARLGWLEAVLAVVFFVCAIAHVAPFKRAAKVAGKRAGQQAAEVGGEAGDEAGGEVGGDMDSEVAGEAGAKVRGEVDGKARAKVHTKAQAAAEPAASPAAEPPAEVTAKPAAEQVTEPSATQANTLT